MADHIDFKNEDFEQQYMKPVAGEEVNVVWGRLAAGNTGYLYYAMPPLLNFDTVIDHDSGHNHTFYKQFHKPTFTNKFKFYYSAIDPSSSSSSYLRLWIDGTLVIDESTIGVTQVTSSVSKEIGVDGADEWLTATVYVNGIYLTANFEGYIDWDSI